MSEFELFLRFWCNAVEHTVTLRLSNSPEGRLTMSNFCINCGRQSTLEPVLIPETEEKPLLERGKFLESEDMYDKEQYVTILECSECAHEMIDLSS